MPKNAFNELISTFFDSSKTKQLWNEGFINNDGGCDVLFQIEKSTSIEYLIRTFS